MAMYADEVQLYESQQANQTDNNFACRKLSTDMLAKMMIDRGRATFVGKSDTLKTVSKGTCLYLK